MRAKIGQFGRSMVEMLGILAIIGVLSVGAIAGYQNAMMKHRLNVHAQGVTFLLMNALNLKDKLDRNETGETYYSNMFKKLNLIPDGFSYINSISLQDSWKNELWIYWNTDQNFGGMGFNFSASSDGLALCNNIVTSAKEFSEDLWIFETYKRYNDDKPLSFEGVIYGDKYCNGSTKKCISSLGLKEQEASCQVCDEKPCTLYVLWR